MRFSTCSHYTHTIEDIQNGDARRHCAHCDDKEEQLSGAAEWLVHVMDIVYGKVEFDALELERCLDECAGYLEVKSRPGDVQVKSSKQ